MGAMARACPQAERWTQGKTCAGQDAYSFTAPVMDET